MYDYREDVINLMKRTQSSDESLMQSAQSLKMLLNMLTVNEKQPDKVINNTQKESITENKPNIIKKAEPNIIEKAKSKPDSSWPIGLYQIQRKLRGAIAKSKNGQVVAYFNEETVHNFELENGDYVDLDIRETYNPKIRQSGQAFINNHIKHPVSNQNILTFGPALVEEQNGQRIVKKDSQNKRLYDVAGIVSYHVSDDLTWINEGDLVELAWYKDEPESMGIRWRYPTTDIDQPKYPRHISAGSN